VPKQQWSTDPQAGLWVRPLIGLELLEPGVELRSEGVRPPIGGLPSSIVSSIASLSPRIGAYPFGIVAEYPKLGLPTEGG
jgi:hypothetical protein